MVQDNTLPLRYGKWRHPNPQHWHNIRKAALERDGYRCVTCNSTEGLNCHHRTYERWGREWLEDVSTLCRECHEVFHEERRAA